MSEKVSEFDLGWYDTPFRSYDPQLGRFHQIDPLGSLFPGINSYNFAYNNPVALNDVAGLCPECDEWARQNNVQVQNGTTHTTAGGWTFTHNGTEWVGSGGQLPEVIVSGVGNTSENNQSQGSAMAWALPIMGGLAADDVTGVGAVDDIAIPILFAVALILDLTAEQAPPTSIPLVVPVTGSVPKDDNNSSITIYKAPAPGLGKKMLLQGLQPEDFPRGKDMGGGYMSDGNAYFAGPNSRKIAQDFARVYGEGILEVTIPKRDYELMLKRLERPYPTGGSEVLVPQELFPMINTYPRDLSPY